MTTETKDLPVIGYYGLNESGYDVIALKENAVLRMFDAGEVTAQPVCLVSDALEAIRASATSAPEHIADVSKLVSEFVIADLAMTHLGSYAEKDYDFAMAVMKALQKAQLSGTTPQPAEGA